jgi:ATP-dependent RNA helicase DBP3
VTPASEEPERKRKRKKREEASEDKTSQKEKKKRRKTDEHAPETLPPTPSTSTHVPASDPSTSEIEEYLQSNTITLTTAKNGPSIIPVLSFDQLQIPPELKAALSDFQSPTPIQACSWPPALQGQDVVGIAETGRYDHIPTRTYPSLRAIGYQRENTGIWHPRRLTTHQVA